MYYRYFTVTDVNLYSDIKYRCKTMDAYIRRNCKYPPYLSLDMSSKEYKLLLHSPTPSFFMNLSDLYIRTIQNVSFTLLCEFSEAYGVPVPNKIKSTKRKSR